MSYSRRSWKLQKNNKRQKNNQTEFWTSFEVITLESFWKLIDIFLDQSFIYFYSKLFASMKHVSMIKNKELLTILEKLSHIFSDFYQLKLEVFCAHEKTLYLHCGIPNVYLQTSFAHPFGFLNYNQWHSLNRHVCISKYAVMLSHWMRYTRWAWWLKHIDNYLVNITVQHTQFYAIQSLDKKAAHAPCGNPKQQGVLFIKSIKSKHKNIVNKTIFGLLLALKVLR